MKNTKSYKTEQEEFWAGKFGSDYIQRNNNDGIYASTLAFISKILGYTSGVFSVLELGANIGLNILALKQLIPGIESAAVEINDLAVKELLKIKNTKVYHQSILEFKPEKKYDLVLSRGVLIHLNPNSLQQVYETMYTSTSKYICIAEYYNPKPISISYRGHKDRLFKRDFAGEILDIYKDLKLLNYGFVYHKDGNFPQDDLTWFLLEKM